MRVSIGVSIGGALLLSRGFAPVAYAACSATTPASNTVVTCGGANMGAVTAQPGSTGVSISIDGTGSGSYTHAVQAVPFSVDTSSTLASAGSITLTGGGGTGTQRGAALLGANNGNRVTNAAGGVINTGGAFNDGMAANGSGNALVNNGSITTSGPNAYGMSAAWGQTNVGQANNTLTNTGNVGTSGSNARAASILGGSGTITNSGTLTTSGSGSPVAYIQGNGDSLVNSGTISATGSGSEGVFSNTASTGFTATIQNLAGGVISSQSGPAVRTLNGASTVTNAGLLTSAAGTAIAMGNGNDTLILQTGSQIVGSADGGAGTNVVTLQGSGTASNAFTNFQTLQMQGSAWNWSGSGTFAQALVQSGTLNLTGTLGTSTTARVDAGATLQSTSTSMPASITDNGLVRFAQDSDGTYAGAIGGTGALEKTGAGTLTIAPSPAQANSWSGGTTIRAGALAISADSAIGSSSGFLTFDGGTLRLLDTFDLAATRAVALNAGGGTIDTQGFDTMLVQAVSGTGTLIKAGSGMLLMNGVSTYSGGTQIGAGTLAIGDAAHTDAALAGGGAVAVAAGATLGGYGRVSGAVDNAGTLAVANSVPGFANGTSGTLTIDGSLVNRGLAQIGAARSVGNRLVVNGNYTGQNATVALNTVVAGDGAASDRLVISNGTASGFSTLAITNVGGLGARTVADGIQVIEAANGATSAPSAFTLAGPVKAGAYEYYLAKGGVSARTADSWYLRSS